MSVERIDDADDPRVAPYRAVRDGELLRTRHLFVAEGRQVVQRVLEDRRYQVQSVLVNAAALRDVEAAIAARGSDLVILLADAPTLTAIAGYDVHRGCLALVQRPAETTIDALLTRQAPLVILEAVANADNVGGVFRNAAAFAAGGVMLSPTCCDPLYRKAIRTSMGATLRVPYARARPEEWTEVVSRIRSAGFTTVALTPREPSVALQSYVRNARRARVAFILGTEGAGLTPQVEADADHRVRIPIASDVDSLNVAVAAGIALHAFQVANGA